MRPVEVTHSGFTEDASIATVIRGGNGWRVHHPEDRPLYEFRAISEAPNFLAFGDAKCCRRSWMRAPWRKPLAFPSGQPVQLIAEGSKLDSDHPSSGGESSTPKHIMPSDANELPFVTRAIYIGATGDITLRLADDTSSHVFKAVPAGTMLPLWLRQVFATGTTASLMVGFY